MGFRVKYGNVRPCRIHKGRLEVENGPVLDINLDIETDFQCNRFANSNAQFVLKHDGKIIVGTSLYKAIVYDKGGTVLRIVSYDSFNPGKCVRVGYYHVSRGVIASAFITTKEPSRVYIDNKWDTYILRDPTKTLGFLRDGSADLIDDKIFPTLLRNAIKGGLHIIGKDGAEIDINTDGYWEDNQSMEAVHVFKLV